MGLIFHKPNKKATGLARREGTTTEKLLQGHALEPHSSRFFQMPTAGTTAPQEHTALSGLAGEMCRSSCQLGENHSSGTQPSGAAFSWTNPASASRNESVSALPLGARPTLLYLLAPTIRPPSPQRHTCPPFPAAPSALFQWTDTFRPPKQEYFEITTSLSPSLPSLPGSRDPMWPVCDEEGNPPSGSLILDEVIHGCLPRGRAGYRYGQEQFHPREGDGIPQNNSGQKLFASREHPGATAGPPDLSARYWEGGRVAFGK